MGRHVKCGVGRNNPIEFACVRLTANTLERGFTGTPWPRLGHSPFHLIGAHFAAAGEPGGGSDLSLTDGKCERLAPPRSREQRLPTSLYGRRILHLGPGEVCHSAPHEPVGHLPLM